MTKGYFITGTDTDCGKTVITLGLMHLLQSKGRSLLGMKPIASGAQPTPEGIRNDDALQIQHQASQLIDYGLVNPYLFEPSIAPHLAAEQAGVKIELEEILAVYEKLKAAADYILVEGVGGWLVPLNPSQAVSDLAYRLGLPVILVVGFRLGCLNHALLTVESIQQKGIALAGWVANMVDPHMLQPKANLESLQARISAPFLGVIPYLETPTAEAVAAELMLDLE